MATEGQQLDTSGVAVVKAQYRRQAVPSGREGPDARSGGGQPAQKQSKKAFRREVKARKAGELCHNFIRGACTYGEGCKFGHDVGRYLENRQPDLPGTCPFQALPACPHSIACRYAGTHDPAKDAFTAQHLLARALPAEASQPSPAEAQAQPASTAQGEQAPPQPAVGPAGQADDPANAAAADITQASTSSGGVEGLEASGAGAEGQQARQALNQQYHTAGYFPGPGEAAAAAGQPAAAEQGDAAPRGGEAAGHAQLNGHAEGPGGDTGPEGTSDIPPGPVALPAPASIEPSLNSMDRDVQAGLRGSGYDFSRAHAVMQHWGAQISARYREQHARRQQGSGQQAQQGQQGHTPLGNGHSTPGAAEPKEGAVKQEPIKQEPIKQEDIKQEAGAGMEVDVEGAAAGPCKRQKLEDGTAGTSHPSAAAGGEAAALARPHEPARGPHIDPTGASVDQPLRPEEKPRLDLRDKLYLAPLTTVGNLPFRRLCKGLGADVTCGEMALATNLLQGQQSEWALLKRHPCEDLFGVQICGGFPDALSLVAQLIEDHMAVDFVDINMGCPLDLVCNKSAGASLLTRPQRVQSIVQCTSSILSCPLTIKVRKGFCDGADVVHEWLPRAAQWGAAAATIHGRTREQRYTKLADWAYIGRCAALAPDLPLVGNGDVMSLAEFRAHQEAAPGVATQMIARGALVKPWLFTEIKEERDWDISAGERLDLLRRFTAYGLEHWGSDARGVETTRRFLLEWLSFLHRYVPVALLETLPQRLNQRPQGFHGRSDLETLFASDSPADWVRISELLLGPPPPAFRFQPKHKSNSYAAASEGAMSWEGDENG